MGEDLPGHYEFLALTKSGEQRWIDFSVAQAGDLASALELIDQQHFDLLISDLGLPDGNGLELMKNLQARGVATPGIALSGYGQEEDIRRSRDAGFAMHLTKPVSGDRLAEAITTVVG